MSEAMHYEEKSRSKSSLERSRPSSVNHTDLGLSDRVADIALVVQPGQHVPVMTFPGSLVFTQCQGKQGQYCVVNLVGINGRRLSPFADENDRELETAREVPFKWKTKRRTNERPPVGGGTGGRRFDVTGLGGGCPACHTPVGWEEDA